MGIFFTVFTLSLFLLLIISVFLFFVIVIRRIYTEKLKRKNNELSQKIGTDILQHMISPKSISAIEIANKYKAKPDMLENLLLKYTESVVGREKHRLTRIFDHCLRERVLKDIHSRRVYRRLKSTRPFVIFSRTKDIPQIIRLLKDKPNIRLAALNALGNISTKSILFQILKSFENKSHFLLREYLNILYGLGEKSEAFIRSSLKREVSVDNLIVLIELIGAIPLPSLWREILTFSNHPNKEIRIRIARALGNLNLPVHEIIDALIKFCSDDAWEVQAQAIRSLGKLRYQKAHDYIAKFLFSPFWYCRLNAGYALVNLGALGIQRLKKVAKQTNDKYAADMALMILNEIVYSQESK